MSQIQNDRHQDIIRESRVAIVGNLFLFILKYWAGVTSMSAALIADAWHTLSDSISSLAIMAGAFLAKKKPDKDHPYGHGRAELIAAVFVGFLLGLIAVEFAIESVQRFIEGESAQFGQLAIIVTIVSIVLKEIMARYALKLHKKTLYVSLKADAWHHRSDAFSSIIILAGILLSRYIWWIDSLLTLIVAILIGITAMKIIKDVIHPLLGEAPDKELINYIESVSQTVIGGNPGLHHVHMHRYGDHTEVTFHIKLPKNMGLNEAHNIASRIENICLKEKNIKATIHPEPIRNSHYSV